MGDASFDIVDFEEVKKPHFSIVINTCGTSAFLQETIDSLLQQTFKNYEIIIIVNGSREPLDDVNADMKLPIVVRCIRDRVSLGAARQLGLDLCRGDWISFLDDDDVFLPDRLEYFAKEIALLSEDYGLIFGSYFLLNNADDSYKLRRCSKRLNAFSAVDWIANYPVGWTTLAVHHSVAKQVSFQKNYNFIVDFAWVLGLLAQTKFHVIHQPLSVYRDHEENLSNTRRDLYVSELEDYIETNCRSLSYLDRLLLDGFVQVKKLRLMPKISIFVRKFIPIFVFVMYRSSRV